MDNFPDCLSGSSDEFRSLDLPNNSSADRLRCDSDKGSQRKGNICQLWDSDLVRVPGVSYFGLLACPNDFLAPLEHQFLRVEDLQRDADHRSSCGVRCDRSSGDFGDLGCLPLDKTVFGKPEKEIGS